MKPTRSYQKTGLMAAVAALCTFVAAGPGSAATLFSANFNGTTSGATFQDRLNSVTQTGSWTVTTQGLSAIAGDALDVTTDNTAVDYNLTATLGSNAQLSSGSTVTFDLQLLKQNSSPRTNTLTGYDSVGNVLFVVGLAGDADTTNVGYRSFGYFDTDFTHSTTNSNSAFIGTDFNETGGEVFVQGGAYRGVQLSLGGSSYDIAIDTGSGFVTAATGISYIDSNNGSLSSLQLRSDFRGGASYDNFIVTGTAIPEPSAALLGGLGLLVLLRRRR